jgi:hypothetical protein
VLKFINFRFALFTPPLGDFHIGQCKKGVHAPHAINYNRARAQHKRKGPTTSSSESLSKHKEILKKLYNISKRIALAKVFEQFNKLLDHST